MKKLRVGYIAGAYTADNTWIREQNIRRAEEVALNLAMVGIAPNCPHTQSRFFFGCQTEEFWLEATMELMRRSDMVVLVKGWEYSSGTLGEIKEANRLGIPIYMNVRDAVDGIRADLSGVV